MDFDFTTETITPDSTNILTVGGDGALQLPSGGTASRPTPEVGLVRLNTTGYTHGTIIEYYDTTAPGWKFMVDATNIIGVGNSVTINNTTGEVTITGQGSGTNNFNYRADTNSQAASNPGVGNLRWNNTTLTGATQIYINGTDDAGIDQAPVFNSLTPGAVIYIQDLSLSSTFQRWTITSITNNTGWYTFAVTLINSNNFSTIANNHRLLVALSSALSNVTSFSAGTTGLLPNTPTDGAITLAGTLVAANGGTGNATYAVGDLLQATASTTLTRLASVATGNALISGGVTTASSWGKIGLTTHVSGTLAPGNGGTGATATPTNGQLLIGNGTDFSVATLGTGTGISTTPGAGTLTINNTGVTSNVATANQTTVSGATGAVTIGLSSTLVTPGSLQVGTSFQTSATNSITAAGTDQGTATILTTDYNVVTTTASGTGVVLPAGLAGRNVIVVNRGANALLVYPASGAQIDALGANVATTLTANATLEIEAISATQWYIVTNSGAGTATSLSSITAAAGANSINNGDNAQIWNWALTTASKSAFTFTENTAATNGAGAQYLLDVGTIAASTANPIRIRAQGNNILTVTSAGSFVLGNAALATGATDGFLYLAGSAGTPAGTPTAFTGRSPITVDTTNNLLYFYTNGVWRGVSGPGGSDTQVQFNDGGSFGGSSKWTFNKNTGALTYLQGSANATPGDISLSLGTPSASGASGGSFAVYGGYHVGGAGSPGSISLIAGNATAGDVAGGQTIITSGQGFGNGVGGPMSLQAGNGGLSSAGDGGNLTITAGNAGTTSTAGGGIVIISAGNTGNGSTSTTGGDVQVNAGRSTSGSSNGGKIYFRTGSVALTERFRIEYNGAWGLAGANYGTSGQVLTSQGTTTAPIWADVTGVTTFSAGTTGLTPNSPTSGAITLAGTLIAANGGTGFASYAVGDILYADTTTTLAKLADVATGNALISGGVGVVPSYGKIGLTTHVSGILPIANGGTNSSTALSGSSIMVSNGTSIIQGAAGTTTTVLHGNAAGAPTYSAVSLTADVSGVLPLANGGTNANLTAVNGGTVYSTGSALAITAAGTSGQVLVSAGAAAPVWTNTAGILQLYKENPSTPTAPTVAGTNAVAIGSGSAAPGNNAIAMGAGTSASTNNTLAVGNGNFATAGDAQELTILSRNTTSNATPTQLFVDGSAQRLVLPNNSAWTFFIKIVGRRTDATGGYAMYTITGGITRDATAATTTLRANTRTIIVESTASMDAAVTADTTNGSLNITVTGIAAQTFRWVATSKITQVTN